MPTMAMMSAIKLMGSGNGKLMPEMYRETAVPNAQSEAVLAFLLAVALRFSRILARAQCQ